MSTNKIRELAEAFRERMQGDDGLLLEAALAEVEAIEKACVIVTDPAEAGNDDAHDEAFRLFAAIAKESTT